MQLRGALATQRGSHVASGLQISYKPGMQMTRSPKQQLVLQRRQELWFEFGVEDRKTGTRGRYLKSAMHLPFLCKPEVYA